MAALRGVNLGGWLVLERWMTPGVFEGAKAPDERGLVAEIGLETARARLKKHRDNFITEQDFEFIKSKGCDFVRLPVGYWLFEEVDGYISGQSYVDQAFKWANRHKLQIILDLHGLPGSQNGKIHSGETGRVGFYQPANLRAGVGVVEYLAKRYGSDPALVGLQLINEPHVRLCARRLLQFYDLAYPVADRLLAPGVKIIVSDAFMPRRVALLLRRRNYGDRLVMDVHHYQLFGRRFQNWNLSQHLSYLASRAKTIRRLSRQVPIMVGEWSGALPAMARQNSPHAEKTFIENQRQLYDDNVWAQCYWSYKKTGRGAWNWRATMYEK